MVKYYGGGVTFSELNAMPLPDLIRIFEKTGVIAEKQKKLIQQQQRGRGRGF